MACIYMFVSLASRYIQLTIFTHLLLTAYAKDVCDPMRPIVHLSFTRVTLHWSLRSKIKAFFHGMYVYVHMQRCVFI